MVDVPASQGAIADAIAFIGRDIGQVSGVGLAVWADGDFTRSSRPPNVDLGGQVCAQ
jgi:hypothetical protein